MSLSVFNTLKDNCLVWNVTGWSNKRSITWQREHAKLRRGKHPQLRNGWRAERTLCRYSVYNNCFLGCFDTRLCKLVSLYPDSIVVNLIRFSRFLFHEIFSSQEGKTLLHYGNQKVYTLWQFGALNWDRYCNSRSTGHRRLSRG